MLCDLPCPHLGMHQTLEAFACWQRDEPCSLSPAPQVGCSSSLPLVPSDLTLPSSTAAQDTSPARHPGATHPLKATTLSGTGNKARACPHSQLVQVHTECGPGFSENQTPPSKRKPCWYVSYDKHCWSGNWTCELSLHFKGTYTYILVHSFDLRY